MRKEEETPLSFDIPLFGLSDFIWTFKGINASEQTPLDVVKFPVYDEPVQFGGRPCEMF